MQGEQEKRPEHRQPKPAWFSEMGVHAGANANRPSESKVEIRMTKSERNPNDEGRNKLTPSSQPIEWVVRISEFSILSDFVIGHSSFDHGTLLNRVFASASSMAKRPKAASSGH